MDWKTAAPVLEMTGAAAESGAALLPEPARSIARFLGAALRLGADVAKTGADPITHIERIHAAEPLLAQTESAWREALRSRFGDRR